MHGIIFAELKKYVETRFGAEAWGTLLDDAGLSSRLYLAVETYEDADALRLVEAASRLAKKPAGDVLEDFGQFITPDLFRMYGSSICREWTTLDLLENVEGTIHRVVRLRNPGASPPELRCSRSAPNAVTIIYASERKMCRFARGLIHGIASHYGQAITLDEPTCLLHGDPSCELVVSLTG